MIITKTDRVELVVLNKPGVLGRVAGHIRREGWNIKHLTVDEDEPVSGGKSETSSMVIDIEGVHTKLAQVMEHILYLDCVVSISMIQNGEKVVRHRPKEKTNNVITEQYVVSIPEKKAGTWRILAINPGSTSTKISLYDDELCIFSQTIRHETAQLSQFSSMLDQKEMRRDCVMNALEKARIDKATIDAIAGR